MAKARRTVRQELSDGSAVIDLDQPAPDKPLEEPGKLPDYGTPVDKKEERPLVTKVEEAPRAADEPDLESQVRALRKREEAAKTRAEEERKARVAAEQARANDASRGAVELERTQFDSVSNALEARKAAAQQAKQNYAASRANNDPIGEADALEQMQRANADIVELERGKVEFERRFEQRRTAPPQQHVVQNNVENILSQMPALNDAERDWIRAHPDSVMNQKQVMRMQAAYLDAEEDGLRRGSPEYFEFFEKRLGYAGAEDEIPQYEEEDMVDEPPPKPVQRPQRPASAAPPSRSSPGATSRQTDEGGGKVTLTVQQREAAKISGIDERTYAQNVQKLNALKRKGHYQETG